MVWLGASTVGRLEDQYGAGSFAEVAATAGGVWDVHARWSVSAQLRAPVWGSPSRAYDLAGGVGVTAVIGKAREAEDDDHHDD